MTRATMPSMSEMMDLNRATSYLDPSNGIMAGQTFQTFPQTFPAENRWKHSDWPYFHTFPGRPRAVTSTTGKYGACPVWPGHVPDRIP